MTREREVFPHQTGCTTSAAITELPLALIPTATVPLLFTLHITSMLTLGKAPRRALRLSPLRATTCRSARTPASSGGPVMRWRRCCARDESARNAGGMPGCGIADGAARRTRGTQTGAPPVPAGRGCRRPSWVAPDQRAAAPARATPAPTSNAGTRPRTRRTGSPAPRPARCHVAAARAADGSKRSPIHGKTAVCPPGTTT